MSDLQTSKQLLRDARDFIGKSRCSMGHSVSEVRDRAKARSCIYCELQFSLYEALGREITGPADETTTGCPVHGECPICRGLRVAGDPRIGVGVKANERREYHANETYWSGVPTVDIPCDFCRRPIIDHDPRTRACPTVKAAGGT